MEINFNCRKCGQKLAVDSSSGGASFNCPTCSEPLVVPMMVPVSPRPAVPATASAVPPPLPKSALRMPTGKRTAIIAGCVMAALLLLLGGVTVLRPVWKTLGDRMRKMREQVGSGRVITATDGSSEVTVPFGWSVWTDLNTKGQLQVAFPAAEKYLVVITEKKSDLPGMTLEKFSAVVRDRMAGKLSSVEQSGPQELQVNGLRAIQYVVKGIYPGKEANVAVTYLHTCAEDSTQFHQIMAWTLQSRFNSNRSDLEKVIATFKSHPDGPSRTSARREPPPARTTPRDPAAVRKPPPAVSVRKPAAGATAGADAMHTRMMGSGSLEFEEVSPDGAVLAGFEVGLGSFANKPVIHSIRPVYRNSQGEVTGEPHGTFDKGQIAVKAKEGYAVAGITVKAGIGIDGMSVTFMRIKDDKTLDASDAYTSEWIGGKGGGRETLLAGTGTPVTGIFGKLNAKQEVNGLGLVLGPSPN